VTQPRNGPARTGAPTTTDFGTRHDDPSQWSAQRTSTAVGSGVSGPADAPTATVPTVGSSVGSAVGSSYVPGGQREAAATSPPRVSRPRSRGPRRARLQLRHINPWTVLKFSAVLAIALFFVWLIMIGVLFGILDGAGIIGKINDAVTTINGPGSKPPITATIVFGGAAIVGVVNMVLFIALSTIGSIVYNLCADLVGGIEITLSER
jgi:hypothetical protein